MGVSAKDQGGLKGNATEKSSSDTVLANADVQLLKNNTVVARTTTDANGSFTLSAKRGKYVLRITCPVTTVDEARQPITQMVTQDVPVKAPAKGLTLTF